MNRIVPGCAVMILIVLFNLHPVAAVAETLSDNLDGNIIQTATLEECLQTALENNHLRPASRYAVEMAEAQHRQALAAYWPQVNLQGGYQRMDESSNFIFPSSDIEMPMGGSIPVTIPGVGTFPVSSFSVPEQDVKLMDEESYRASLEATWLLYDGGMRKGYREQTKGLVEAMRQESRRTDLEVVDSVKRFYYGAVLAARLHQLGNDTLARMEATLNLTETMYKEGSGRVKKTDYLDNKVMVASIRAMVALLEKNELMARAALANTMGMSWNASVKPVDTELPYTPFSEDLNSLVSSAYRFNPDWAKVEAGLMAAEGAVRTAKSGYFPKLALTGELFKWWNDYDAGMATDRNKDGWNIGVGVEIPLFSGFLTRNKVDETRARVAKIKEEQILLKEGLGLQIKDIVLSLNAAQKTYQATLDAMTAAVESRDLNTRAYQNELVKTEDVVKAQLMEALMSARHYKTCYEHVALLSQLNLVVGTEVLKMIEK
jgi:outer membrane protein